MPSAAAPAPCDQDRLQLERRLARRQHPAALQQARMPPKSVVSTFISEAYAFPAPKVLAGTGAFPVRPRSFPDAPRWACEVPLATGLCRGERLALAWVGVDLDAGKLCVAGSPEQTKAGLHLSRQRRATAGASYRSRRPGSCDLRAHQKAQGPSEGALVFSKPDGTPRAPNATSNEFGPAKQLHLPEVNFHVFRHTQASQLIAAGMVS
jgi:integrase